MSFVIEDGIPLPRRAGKGGRPWLYPFPDLKPGQSFFVPGKTVRSISGHACSAGKRLGCKFILRTVEGGVRVWRDAAAPKAVEQPPAPPAAAAVRSHGLGKPDESRAFSMLSGSAR